MSCLSVFTEQIFQNIRQEYSRYQRRRQLEGAFNQTETGVAVESSNPSSPSGQNTHSNSKPWVKTVVRTLH